MTYATMDTLKNARLGSARIVSIQTEFDGYTYGANLRLSWSDAQHANADIHALVEGKTLGTGPTRTTMVTRDLEHAMSGVSYADDLKSVLDALNAKIDTLDKRLDTIDEALRLLVDP